MDESLIHLQRLGHVVDEPRGRAEAPRHMALPGSHGPLGDIVLAQLRVDAYSCGEWASVVEEASVEGNLRLLDETKVKELGVRLSSIVGIHIVKPVVRVLLEAVSEGGLCVSCNSLDWVIWQMFSRQNSIDQRLTAFCHDYGTISVPVWTGNDIDTVVTQEVHVILSIHAVEVLLVRAGARSHQSRNTDVLVVPFWDLGQACESLGCTL